MKKIAIIILLNILPFGSFFLGEKCSCLGCWAQDDRQAIRKGNKIYRQKQEWDKAETQYRKAEAFNRSNAQAHYNLGCALMQQGKDSTACLQFEEAIRLETDKLRKSQSYHNIGVMLQSQKQFEQAINAYKESLRLNPKDDETRYNLVLCQKQLKKQNKNNQNKNKQNQQNKDQKDKNRQQQDKNKQDKQNQQPKPQPQQMSKDNAEQLLQAAMQNEKNTQQKLKKQQGQPQRKSNQMNW